MAHQTPIEHYRINVCSPDSTFEVVELQGSVKELKPPKKDPERNVLWYNFISKQPSKHFGVDITINYKHLFFKQISLTSLISNCSISSGF